MSQRIVLTSECNCSDKDSVYITNGSTIKLSYHFTPAGLPSFTPINPNCFDMIAEYWINGIENEKVGFIKPSISTDRIIIDTRKGTVQFIMNDYKLSNGRLMYRLKFRLPDPMLPGRQVEDIAEGYTGIILK